MILLPVFSARKFGSGNWDACKTKSTKASPTSWGLIFSSFFVWWMKIPLSKRRISKSKAKYEHAPRFYSTIFTPPPSSSNELPPHLEKLVGDKRDIIRVESRLVCTSSALGPYYGVPFLRGRFCLFTKWAFVITWQHLLDRFHKSFGHQVHNRFVVKGLENLELFFWCGSRNSGDRSNRRSILFRVVIPLYIDWLKLILIALSCILARIQTQLWSSMKKKRGDECTWQPSPTISTI